MNSYVFGGYEWWVLIFILIHLSLVTCSHLIHPNLCELIFSHTVDVI